MAKNTIGSICWIILNLAVGALLAIGGIWALQNGGDVAAAAVGKFFGSKPMVTVFGVIELLSGIFIILQVFIGDRFGKLDEILKLIVVIVWVIAIVVKDMAGASLSLPWLYQLSLDIIVLAALLITRK